MTQKKSWLLSALGALAIAGCQVDDVGPEVRCAECPDVLEPGAAVELHLEWHEEPCDHPSRYAGPLVTWCTDVEITREVSCDGPCEVEEDRYDSDRRYVTALEEGPLTVTTRLTRVDTGEVHEETLPLRVTWADRLELRCVGGDGECGRRERLDGSVFYELELEAFVGDEPIGPSPEGLEADAGIGTWSADGGNRLTATVDALEEGPRTVTVWNAAGATASITVPGADEY